MKTQACIWLSAGDRATLEHWVSNRNTPQKMVWRARIVLLSADRFGMMAITRAIGMSKVTVNRWQERLYGTRALPVCGATGRDPGASHRWRGIDDPTGRQ